MISRTSSPVPDSVMAEPYDIPEAQVIADTDVKTENEFAALGLNQKFPAVVQHLRTRQDYYRQFLPGNIPMEQINYKNYTEWEIAQKTAFNVISEIESFINIIETQKDAVQQARRR